MLNPAFELLRGIAVQAASATRSYCPALNVSACKAEFIARMGGIEGYVVNTLALYEEDDDTYCFNISCLSFYGESMLGTNLEYDEETGEYAELAALATAVFTFSQEAEAYLREHPDFRFPLNTVGYYFANFFKALEND